VLREALALVLFGIAIGIPYALAATRLIACMLFDLSPSDLPTIAAVSLPLLLVAPALKILFSPTLNSAPPTT
jgi:hypothetical protein